MTESWRDRIIGVEFASEPAAAAQKWQIANGKMVKWGKSEGARAQGSPRGNKDLDNPGGVISVLSGS